MFDGFIIVRRTSEDKPEHDLPHEKTASKIMGEKSYIDYIKKHGYHFTEELAHEASKWMENADGSKHSWTTNQVNEAIQKHKIAYENTNKCTPGDLCYLANMAYADGFYEGIPDKEKLCLEYATKIADDPDGYKGMPFMRWVADIIGKGIIDIDWTKYP